MAWWCRCWAIAGAMILVVNTFERDLLGASLNVVAILMLLHSLDWFRQRSDDANE
jgi:hypothetical protein